MDTLVISCKLLSWGFSGTEAELNPIPLSAVCKSSALKLRFCVFSRELMKPEKICGEKTPG